MAAYRLDTMDESFSGGWTAQEAVLGGQEPAGGTQEAGRYEPQGSNSKHFVKESQLSSHSPNSMYWAGSTKGTPP